MSPPAELVELLLARLRQVRDLLGLEAIRIDAQTRFADAVDSMAFVEFLALAADDCGVPVEAIEQATERRYGTIAELAKALHSAKIEAPTLEVSPLGALTQPRSPVWLAATAAAVPAQRQSATEIDVLLNRPAGWLEQHAGIRSRCLWDGEDALDAASNAARECLQRSGLSLDGVSALLVTSEAPPMPAGLAAALHHRLRLSPGVVALEIGGACTGFLAALWTARRLLADMPAVLVLAVESPSCWLTVEPGPAGEAAALFGEAAAACLLTAHPRNETAIALRDICLFTNGAAGSLLRPQYQPGRGLSLYMDGVPLAHRAVRVMADAVRNMSANHGLVPDQLAAVVAHGGNGRIPALLARRLNLPADRIRSTTAETGNLGSASLPVAWAAHADPLPGPMMWTAVGAGLQWGAALFDAATAK